MQIHIYDGLGREAKFGVDMDRNHTLDQASGDRITRTDYSYTTHGTIPVFRRETYAWLATGSSVATLLNTTDSSLDDTTIWSTRAGAITINKLTYGSTGAWTEKNTAPDGSYDLVSYSSGRMISRAHYSSGSVQTGGISFLYDSHGRLWKQTDTRIGTAVTAYTSTDRPYTITTPAPISSMSTLVTSNVYDSMDRVTETHLPDTTVTYNEWFKSGLLKKNYGSQAYTANCTYDGQGRIKTMATTGSTAETTTWSYDYQRGRLEWKHYNDGKGPAYQYTAAGRLYIRTWARTVSGAAVTTTYGYDNAGSQTLVNYSDSTPDVTTTYYRVGQPYTITDGLGTRTFAWRASDQQLQSETLGGMSNKVITRTYDSLNRPSGLQTGTTATPNAEYEVVYGYDTANRLNTITQGGDTWTYAYLSNSTTNRIASLTGPAVLTSYSYEAGRDGMLTLENKSTGSGGATYSKFAYDINNLGKRKSVVHTGSAFSASAFNTYGYNGTGEVTGAQRYFGTNTSVTSSPVSSYNYGFAFDGIGNRTSSTLSGTATNYTSNALNQYTVVGSASPAYDDDGNITSDGTWIYRWDAENQLIALTSASGGQSYTFSYDYLGRRYEKKIFATSTATVPTSVRRWLYDEWNIVAEYDYAPSTGVYTNLATVTWGLDVSNSIRGAGGVGGLLERTITSGTLKRYFTCDGNGNISEMIGTSNNVLGHYEYGPFGETVVASGSQASTNPIRFSSKYLDESGLYYYGYRFYNSTTGRWLSMEPKAEKGGLNLYSFLSNSSIQKIDYLGNLAFNFGIGLAASGTIFVPGPHVWGLGFSVTYSEWAAVAIDTSRTAEPVQCAKCRSGAVTVMGGWGAAVNVSAGPIFTWGRSGDINTQSGLAIQVGYGAGFPDIPGTILGPSTEVTVDVDIKSQQVTLTIPKAGFGATAYMAVRVTGSCTGCTGLFGTSTVRQTKISDCLGNVIDAISKGIASIDGKPVSETAETVYTYKYSKAISPDTQANEN